MIDNILIDIKTTGLDVVKDDIFEITVINVSTKTLKEFRLHTNKRLPPELMLQHGINSQNYSILKNNINFEYISSELFSLLNNTTIFCYNVKHIKSFLIEKFATIGLLLDSTFISISDWQTISNPINYNEVCKKVLNSNNKYISSGKDRLFAMGKLVNELSGKRISNLTDNDVKNIIESIESNKHIQHLESSGKIILNKHTNRIIISFGKYFGSSIKELPQDYIEWLLNNKNFSIEFKSILNKCINLK